MANDDNNILEQEDTQKGRYLTFLLGEELFGIEIQYVTEIIGVQPITPIPNVPDYIRGVINLRSKIIPVVDMRLKFHKELIDYNDRTCIVVVDIPDMTVGLIVDTVAEVCEIPEEAIVETPPSPVTVNRQYITGIANVNNEIKLLLDGEKLLMEDDLQGIGEDNK